IRTKLEKSKKYHINYRVVIDEKIEYQQLCIVNVSHEKHIFRIIFGCRVIDDEIREGIEKKKILEKALSYAKTANIAQDTFLSNMSHDIRTPLNAILGYAALAKKYIDEKSRVEGYLNGIEEAGVQLLNLVNDVLEISKIEAGKVDVQEIECNLKDVARKIYKKFCSKIEKKEIAFSQNTFELKHDWVYSDPRLLEKILFHLIGNAVKYTEKGGEVKLTIAEQPQLKNDYTAYQFIVEDNGVGISESFLEHLFEPFERQRNTTLSGSYGTGLGLTITKNVVDMLGGTIEVNSVEGEGSCFTVLLHMRVKEGGCSYSDADKQERQKLSSHRRILLVEDNEINLEIEEELLKGAGFFVETAVNGKIAVEKVRASQPGEYSLVLMDIQMPIMDGYHATREIRGLEDLQLAKIPIIALSANNFEKDIKMSLESGMDAHMAKPVNTSQLLDLIENILE
ncbi:MAG: response regulator, partial [Lachnospiraceae bacterium]|nr:response regulator [Lachnospiraceae bacterium]